MIFVPLPVYGTYINNDLNMLIEISKDDAYIKIENIEFTEEYSYEYDENLYIIEIINSSITYSYIYDTSYNTFSYIDENNLEYDLELIS